VRAANEGSAGDERLSQEIAVRFKGADARRVIRFLSAASSCAPVPGIRDVEFNLKHTHWAETSRARNTSSSISN
jgi:hypothetical protein